MDFDKLMQWGEEMLKKGGDEKSMAEFLREKEVSPEMIKKLFERLKQKGV